MCFLTQNKKFLESNFLKIFFLFFFVFSFCFIRVSGEANKTEESSLLTFEEPMPFQVYLPAAAVSGEGEQRFPVLYLLHGQSQNETIWGTMGLFDLADRLIADGTIQPLIIVTPREENYLGVIQDSAFGQKILNELIPLVDERFPTINERSSRAIGGISRGAVWAQYLCFKNYEVFAVLGQHSLPSQVVSSPLIYRQRETYRESLPEIQIRIDSGENDPYLDGARILSAQLASLNYPHTFVINPGGHNVDYWTENLEQYLIWYSQSLNKAASAPDRKLCTLLSGCPVSSQSLDN